MSKEPHRAYISAEDNFLGIEDGIHTSKSRINNYV